MKPEITIKRLVELPERIRRALDTAVAQVKDSCFLTQGPVLNDYHGLLVVAKGVGIDTRSYETEVREYLRT